MNTRNKHLRRLTIGLGLALLWAVSPRTEAAVNLIRTPDDGIQPQAAMDAKGALHLVYFKGDAKAGDVFYVRSTDDGATWSTALRVNSQPNSAVAMGTVRGAQLTIGKNNRIHVAWNGSEPTVPKINHSLPMLYSRLNDAGDAFEPQRNLITWTSGLDGGGALAADRKGNVYVAWHANAGKEDNYDAGRAVFLARSTNDGRTFSKEKKISIGPTGACGCCQMRALTDDAGVLYVLYRAAGENVNRDSMLLVSKDGGQKFQSAILQKWKLEACPLATYALASSNGAVFAAWKTEDQIYRSTITPATTKFSTPVAAPHTGPNRKYPTLAVNARGETLLAWTEDTGWARGGKLAWQVYDKNGDPTADKGLIDGVPVWGLPSAITRADGDFDLIY